MIVIPLGENPLANLVAQLNRALNAVAVPAAPTRLFAFSQTASTDLPDPARHTNCQAIFDGKVIFSDGTAWLNADGSAL